MPQNSKKEEKEILYGVQKQQLKDLSAKEYKALKELCFLSKNMYNVALYNIRQHYFTQNKFLNYIKNYHVCKTNENYVILNSNSAQQIMKIVDANFKSFFGLLKLAKAGKYKYSDVRMPSYLPKDSLFEIVFCEFNVTTDKFAVPMSAAFKSLYGKIEIAMPKNLKSKLIKKIIILPRNDARFFEIQWIYVIEEFKGSLNKKNTLAIDLGVDNLCTCTTNSGKAFIIDGKKLKSINQGTNKRSCKLQSIKDKQNITRTTKAQGNLWNKRGNKVNDYLAKTARLIIDYCITNDIGSLVVGSNKNIQKVVNLGRVNNQNFVNIPIGQLRAKLKYLSKRYKLVFIEQEESYTSKADFLATDNMPVYDALIKRTYIFSGKRTSRGQYKSSMGIILNADINASLNIMRKAEIKNICLMYNEYMNPKRIKIA
ncbi:MULTISPECIES: RNA-guided endonuclease InsQ/TnpB family protein [Clostridium]|uniref:Transposase n=1 Tax=Clostridium frigoriphilum TaxID=443253 RepID=A0ABU7USM4_9CLOT|nr:transposase [Clostridium sp. DSM 17811]